MSLLQTPNWLLHRHVYMLGQKLRICLVRMRVNSDFARVGTGNKVAVGEQWGKMLLGWFILVHKDE